MYLVGTIHLVFYSDYNVFGRNDTFSLLQRLKCIYSFSTSIKRGVKRTGSVALSKVGWLFGVTSECWSILETYVFFSVLFWCSWYCRVDVGDRSPRCVSVWSAGYWSTSLWSYGSKNLCVLLSLVCGTSFLVRMDYVPL